MIRGTLIAFLLGWATWFWLDKSPVALGPMPFPQDGEFLQNFQVFFDLVKQTRFKAAFIYIWKAHYLVLSLAIGLLLGMLANALLSAYSRRRLIKLYLPNRKQKEQRKTEAEDH